MLSRLIRREFTLEELVYGLGVVKLGMSFSVVRKISDFIDVLRNLGIYRHHRKKADLLLARYPQMRGTISRELGCGRLKEVLIPGFEEMIATARTLVSKKQAGVKIPADEPYINLIDDLDLVENPIFFNVATSPELVAAVTDYLGIMPQLRNISILFSRPGDGLFSSKQFHLDKLDCGMVGLWVNVIDTSSENGPFTFVPAHTSQRVCRRYGYERQTFVSHTRISDEEMKDVVSPDEVIPVQGSVQGNTWLVDTSRCFHMGGRCAKGIRATLHIRYCLPHKIDSTYRYRLAPCDHGQPLAKDLLLRG